LTTLGTFDDPEDYLGAVAIRILSDEEIGEPVAWIELLSPSNKPYAHGYDDYYQKRMAALLGGLVLAEG